MDIDNLTGYEFENLTEDLIKKLGFITEERKKSADGGIDIRAINEQPIFKGLYIIQCKRHNKPIGEAIIRDLFGVVSSERANKGILITNSRFTKSAIDFARNKPIELIDGDKFFNLLEKNIDQEKIRTNSENIERYSITLRCLEEGSKKIKKRRQEIMSDRVYLSSKYFKSEKSYFDFIEREANKLFKITKIFSNQLENIPIIWNKFLRNQNNFTNTQELKNQCKELLETLTVLEEEQEKIISAVPPDNFHLVNINKSLKNTYDQLFEIFFNFLSEVWLLVNDPDNPRIQEKIEDGLISFNYEFSSTEIENMLREMEEYTNDINRQSYVQENRQSRCFVATVVYEDVDALEVIRLRNWRDTKLNKSLWGSIIIKAYYLLGPYFARIISTKPKLKKVIRNILDRIVKRLPSIF